MGAAAQRLSTACLLCCLLAATSLQAHAKIIKRSTLTLDTLSVAGIQDALAKAAEGDEVVLPPGRLDITGTFFQISKGVTLSGGPTTLFTTAPTPSTAASAGALSSSNTPTTCLGEGEGQAMLEVCAPVAAGPRARAGATLLQPASSSTPVIIRNITFQYGGPQNPATAFSEGFKGVAVKMTSPLASGATDSTISGCSFIDTDVGIEVFGAAGWKISDNTFDGSGREVPGRGVWINSPTDAGDPSVPVPVDLWVSGNHFTGFTIGVGGDFDDYLYGLVIEYNTFKGTAASSASQPSDKAPENTDIIAISLSANIPPAASSSTANGGRLPPAAPQPRARARLVSTAAAVTQPAVKTPAQQQGGRSWRQGGTADDRGWEIANNQISGVTVGVEFTYDDFSATSRRGSHRAGPGSLSGVWVQYNSIVADGPGCPTGCYPLSSNYHPLPSDNLTLAFNWWGTTNPSLARFLGLGSLGPITPFIKTYKELPGCTSGFCVDIATINVVAPAITAMAVTPSPAPAGSTITVAVTLQAMFDGGSLTITSTLAGVVCQTPIAFDSTSPNPIKLTCTLPQAPASVHAAAAAQERKWIKARVAVAPTVRQYTVVARVAGAGGTATKQSTLGVCNNQPWPFRADVESCEGCTYNCATRQFTCTSCSCRCPQVSNAGYNQPGAQEGEQPFQQQASYGGGLQGSFAQEGLGGGRQHPEGKRHVGEEDDAERSYSDGTHAYDQEEDGGAATPLEEQEDEDRELRVPLSQPIAAAEPDAPSKPVAPRSLGDVMHDSDNTYQGAGARTHRASREDARREGDATEAEALLREMQEERPAKPVAPKSLSDVMLGGLGHAQVASTDDQHSVSTAAAWHPLITAATTKQPDCSASEPQCTCDPLPLAVTAQCSLIVYDACTNTLKCSSNGSHH